MAKLSAPSRTLAAVRAERAAPHPGSAGNRISASGRQEPSLEVYREGEVRSYHAIAEGGDAGFIASAAHMVDLLRNRTDQPVLDGATSRAVLNALLCALDSADRGALVTVEPSRART